MIWLSNCLLTILFYIFIQKESLPELKVLAEVFGIDIVHAVEFSKIGCFCDFPSGSYAEQLLKSTDFGAAVNSWLPSFFQRFPSLGDLNPRH